MQIKPFLQVEGGSSTLDQVERLIEYIRPTNATFCFAYTTLSGCAEFQRRVGPRFWGPIRSHWLVGIDYGRTQPAALEFLAGQQNTTVRIFDGAVVVQQAGFFPERDFHPKAMFLNNEAEGRYALLAGSGNLSRSGLVSNVECGISLAATTLDEYRRVIRPVHRQIVRLWNHSDPLDDVLDRYKERWTPGDLDPADAELAPDAAPTGFDRFWIDVGYVTRNRGPNRPGNQIDMPRGVHAFFGLQAPPNLPPNSPIGDVTFVSDGPPIIRTLRFGNNMMEKITLPFPEDFGFGAYDGKILEFRRAHGGFQINAFELEEFGRSLRRTRLRATHQMGSGRRYGYR